MKNKKRLLFLLTLVIVVVGVVVFFISRPHHEELLPQTFAELPDKPKLIAAFNHSATLNSDIVYPEGFSSESAPRIYAVSFSPIDASLIACINGGGTINVWNINNTKKPIRTLKHPGVFPFFSFSPTGKLIASAGSGKLVLWDVASGSKMNTLESTNDFAFSPDGNQLAIVLNGVKLLDIRNPKKITQIATLSFDEAHKVKDRACAVGISSDGKWIATGYSHGTINVWDLKTRQLAKTLETPLAEMEYLKFSPDNKLLACGGPQLIFRDNQYWQGPRPWNCIMWELSSWKRYGEVQRGHLDNLAFSPDGKMCAYANSWPALKNGVEIWNVESGAPIVSLPIETPIVAFSPDGKMLATGNEDGIVQLWGLTSQHLELPKTDSDVVRIIYFPDIIYFLDKDKKLRPNITAKIDKAIRAAQDYYADEMERHGFGRKTFTYETDENGKTKIYLGTNKQVEHANFSKGLWLAVSDKLLDTPLPVIELLYTDDNERFEYASNDNYSTKDNIRHNVIKGYTHAQLIYTSLNDLKRKPLAYVLRDSFGLTYTPLQHKPNFLKRLFNRVNDKMPWGKRWAKLSKCEAEWLDKSRFFNPNQPFFDNTPKMEMRVSLPKASGLRHFIFEVADADGMQQAQLLIPINMDSQRWIKRFYECQALNGKDKATITFEISNPAIETVVLRMIDMHGNIASREFMIEKKTDEK